MNPGEQHPPTRAIANGAGRYGKATRVSAAPETRDGAPHAAHVEPDPVESHEDGATGTHAEAPTEASLPIVRRIQASFRDRIRSGELPPGTKLPSMRNLSTEFGCSLGIVKQAVTTLAAQGFLRSSPRRGVFVADGPPAGREVAIVLPHLEIKRLHLAMSGIRAGLAAGLRDGSYRIGIHAGLAEPAAVERSSDSMGDRPLPAAGASEAVLSHLCSAQVAGVMLLLPSAGEHDHLRRRLRDRGVPVVTVEIASRTRPGGGAEDVVTFNPDALAAMSVDRLVEAGHREIAVVQSAQDSRVPPEVFQGLDRAFDRHGLPGRRVIVERPAAGERPWLAAREAVREALGSESSTTAIIGVGPQLTLGARLALRDLGRSVPGDVSLMGILGDSSALQSSDPPITVLDNPIYRICAAAARRLGTRMDGPDDPPAVIEFEPELIDRGSVARPNGNSAP